MLLSAVSVLVVAQSSSEIPEGVMNNPVNAELWSTLRIDDSPDGRTILIWILDQQGGRAWGWIYLAR